MKTPEEVKSPRYVLVYLLLHRWEGEEAKVEFFEREEEMHDRVNELAPKYTNDLHIAVAGWLHHEFEYTPVKEVITYEAKRRK